MITVEQAIKYITSLKRKPETETVSLLKSLNRVLAENIFADRDYPPYNRSAMDGYAVNSNDIFDKNLQEFKVISEAFAGDNKNFPLRSGEAVKIMTGAVVPDDTDVVIKKEDIEKKGELISFQKVNVKKYQNIALKGEDVKKDELVIAKHVRINSNHLSVLASIGKNKVPVLALPKVAVLSTGYEIKPVDASIAYYQVRDSNSYSISGFLQDYSIQPVEKMIVKDDLKKLKSIIEKLLTYDILIISGGVSAGDADLVPLALKECGVEEVFHRVKIKPGKPIWFGYYPGGLRVFALPGNPYSVQVACKIFIEPYLRACFGLPIAEPLKLPINIKKKKKTGFDEFIPAKLINKNCLRVEPLFFNGSGDITALTNADGIAHHPNDVNDINQGDIIKFYPVKNFLL